MKKYTYILKSILITVFALTALFGAAASASAAGVTWNMASGDCPATVVIANHTTQENASSICWGSLVNASAGDEVDVRIAYHNTGTVAAPNTIAQINMPSGASQNFSFTGFIDSNGAQRTGSAVVHISSTQSLTLVGVLWYRNGIADTALPTTNIQNLGTVPAGYVGSVKYRFMVSNNTTTTGGTTCTINSFSASPTSVTSGSTSNLSWNTTGCSSVSITGGMISGNVTPTGSKATNNLYATTTYVLSAAGSNGTRQASAIVNVRSSSGGACTIGVFNANPTSVTTGGSSTLSWSTTNCANVTVSGPTGTLSTLANGSVSTGSLSNTSNFTISAAGAASQTVTVTVNGTQNNNCKIDSFLAAPTSIAQGATSTLAWNTTGCRNVSVYGTGVSSNLQDGSILTPALYYTTTYTISAYGDNGAPVTQNVIVNVNSDHNCKIDYFNANPTTVQSGSQATITWGTSNCVSATLSGFGVASSSLSGSISTGVLTASASYTLTGYGASGVPITQTIPVTVNAGAACRITSFIANPPVVAAGSLSTLSWVTPNCTNVTISGGTNWSNTPIFSNSIGTEPLYNTTTYTLSAYGTGSYGTGSITQPVTQTVTVTVQGNQSNCAVNSFYASPTQVAQGGSATLYWNTTGCSNVTVSGPNVSSFAYSNSLPIGPIYNTATYTITASSNGMNPVTQSTTVSTNYVNNQNPPQVTTSPATNIAGTSATLNGFITTSPQVCTPGAYCGVAPQAVNYYFMYGTSQYSLNQQTPTQSLYNGSGSVSAYVSNLMPNQTYYFQLVGSNQYGSNSGVVLSFVSAGQQTANITAITSLATNVTATSARLNGLVYGTQNNALINTYFEYGTSPSLGTQTGLQNVSVYSATNYFDTISTSPNTTYYYRIVAVSNGQTFPGATVSFTTGSGTVFVQPPTVITRVINTGTGGGSAYVALTITDQSQNVYPGDSINYTVTYQNISGSTLTNAVLNVILPAGVTFRQASQGVLTTNNTIAITLGTLLPNQPPATINIFAVADLNIIAGNNFVTTATLAFTTPSRAQDSAIAYVLNTVGSQNNLAGLALFGAGFFPNSLLGWILLIGLILILIFIARYFFHRANSERVVAPAPVTHVHYDQAPQSYNPQNQNSGGMNHYSGTNLPH